MDCYWGAIRDPHGASSRSRGGRAGVLVVWRGSVPRGEDCALCRGRTFIKDGYVLISVICNRTQSSCGKYVPTEGGAAGHGPRSGQCVGGGPDGCAGGRLTEPRGRTVRAKG